MLWRTLSFVERLPPRVHRAAIVSLLRTPAPRPGGPLGQRQMQQLNDIITSLKWTLYVSCNESSGIRLREKFSMFAFFSRVVVPCLMFSEVVLRLDND